MEEKAAAKEAHIAEFSNQLEGVIKELFSAAGDEADGWTNVHNKKGVTVDVQYKEGESLASARTKVFVHPLLSSSPPLPQNQSLIKASVEDVYRFTQSVEFLEDVDPLYLDGRVCTKIPSSPPTVIYNIVRWWNLWMTITIYCIQLIVADSSSFPIATSCTLKVIPFHSLSSHTAFREKTSQGRYKGSSMFLYRER